MAEQDDIDITGLLLPPGHQEKVQSLKVIDFDSKLIRKDLNLLADIQAKIRESYIKQQPKPHHFCSYEGFANIFKQPNMYETFKAENLNIIDIHLRQPSINGSHHQQLWQLRDFTLLDFCSPYFTLTFLIAISKISLSGNTVKKKLSTQDMSLLQNFPNKKVFASYHMFLGKLRRVIIYDRLKQYMVKNSKEIPAKYIKFGQYSQYIFHTKIGQIQQSSIYLTQLFENYIRLTNISPSKIKQFLQSFRQLKEQFKIYKKIQNKKQLPIFIDEQKLIKYKDIKQEQIYNLSKQIETRFRRWLQLGKYYQSGQFFMSGFSFNDLLHLNKHYDLLAPQRYNKQGNTADLAIFYGVYLAAKLIKTIIKRSIKF